MRIVISGIGGQGVVFLSRLISDAAHREGTHVVSAETHGMAQRGASVISFVKLGDFLSPLIRKGTADIALCLKESECANAVTFLAPGSRFIVDSAGFTPAGELKEYIQKRGLTPLSVASTSRAAELGNKRGGNLYMLGFSLGQPAGNAGRGLPPLERFISAICSLSPAKFRNINIDIISAGYKAGMESNGQR